MNTTIQIRIDDKTKKAAQKSLNNMGLDITSGIKYFLTQVSKVDNLSAICEFGYLHSYSDKMLKQYKKESDDAIKNGKRYTSAKELLDDILK